MNARTFLTAAALLAATTLTACGGAGGASGSLTPPAGGGSGSTASVQSQTEDSINTANAVGAPVSDVSSYNESMSSPLQSSGRIVTDAVTIKALGDGTCNNGVEFFSPDKKGDANS